MKSIPSSLTTNKMTVGLIIVVLAMLTAPAISNLMKINVVAEINPPPPGEGQIHYHSGDWIIEAGDNVYRGNQTIVLKGNLTILGGTLTFQNVTLIMNCTEDGEFEINVTANGRFRVYNSNITAFDTTTPAVHYPGEPWEYTTYGLLYRFKVYGNMTIEDSYVSYMWGSWDPFSSPNYIGGIEIYSDDVIINKSSVFKGSVWGIYSYQASPTIINNIISDNDRGIGFYISGGLIAYNNITSSREGIRCEFSSPTITHNNITSTERGLVLAVSNAIVTNNYISNNDCGIRSGNSDPYIANNTIVNNKDGIYFSESTAGITINNTIKDNSNIGVRGTGSTNPIIVNCTVENNKYAFYNLGSHTTTINTTFDGAKVYMDSGSTLTVKNYLHVLVLDASSNPLPGADIIVTDNGNPITLDSGGMYLQTDVDGFIRWIVVTDRIYIGSSTATENITTAEVSYPPKTFVDNPRDVNMSTSHTEVFVEVGGAFLPDFVLSRDGITFNPPSPVKDKTLVTIGATIHNIGLEEGLNIVVRFYDGVPSPANLIGEDQIPSIPALGGVGLAEVMWSATPVGMHNIYIVVDPDNVIVETDEANNIANRTIDVGIPLSKGWNLISIPYIQSNTNLGTVLNSIDGSYDAVQWYNATDANDQWKHYQISKPSNLNDLDDIDHTMGFWVHITQPGETIFMFNGVQPIQNQTITLYPGWNHVGYPSLTSYNRTDGLNNVTFGNDVDSIWSYEATTQKWAEMSPSDYFEPGRGYWIHSKVEKVWIVPF